MKRIIGFDSWTRGSHHFARLEREARLGKAVEHFAREVLFHAVGLEDDERFFHRNKC